MKTNQAPDKARKSAPPSRGKANSPQGNKTKQPPATFAQALQKSGLSFLCMAPMLLGVMGLVGLLQVLVSPEQLSALFRGHAVTDTLVGTLSGAVASGNPVVSYLLGGELLAQGIPLYAVTAFVLSWVTLGFVHLPAEADTLGLRLTIRRNILAFFFTMIIAVCTGVTVQVLS